jgi:hypothetical protein
LKSTDELEKEMIGLLDQYALEAERVRAAIAQAQAAGAIFTQREIEQLIQARDQVKELLERLDLFDDEIVLSSPIVL